MTLPNYRERPACRRVLDEWMAEKGLTLVDVLRDPYSVSEGMRIQARKMLVEQGKADKVVEWYKATRKRLARERKERKRREEILFWS